MDIEPLRQRIDAVDTRIARLLARRQALVEKIAQRKRAGGTLIHDPVRERIVLEKAARNARESGLDASIAQRVFAAIVASMRGHAQRNARERGRKAKDI
jgi:chorismate mutase